MTITFTQVNENSVMTQPRTSVPNKCAEQVCRTSVPNKCAEQVCRTSVPNKCAEQVNGISSTSSTGVDFALDNSKVVSPY